jgi:hypothetical protein
VYSLQSLLQGVRNPQKVGREINKLIHTRGGRHNYNPDGIDIFDQDWDNLIILDACRYDLFAEIAELPGELKPVYSRGSATYNFISANFANRKVHDTVYVGGNSWFLKLKDEINAEVHDFIDLQYSDEDVDWAHEELLAVTPETVTEAAIEADEKYPNKRLIIHYIQPHHPFIGSIGRESFIQQSSSLIDVIKASDTSDEPLWQAYKENLEIVLPEVRNLLDTIPGKTVVTADHGEMLGDRHDYIPVRDYGHHKGIFNDATVKIPWLINETNNRKKIVSDPPVGNDSINMESVNDQLQHLGYKIE